MSPIAFSGPRAPARAQQYWLALHCEFELFAFLLTDGDRLRLREPGYWNAAFDHCQRRVPMLFQNLRDIMIDLTAVDSMSMIEEGLNSTEWMTQIRSGGLDFASLSAWWGEVLISQCAPSRDDSVRQLEQHIAEIKGTGDAHAIVSALKELLLVIEVMKLDRANHVIRACRHGMLGTVTPFLQHHYHYSIRIGMFDATSGTPWYDQDPPQQLPPVATEDERVKLLGASHTLHFLNRSVDSLLACTTVHPAVSMFPSTFHYDFERLDRIWRELHWLIYREICVERLGIVFQSMGRAHQFNDATTAPFLGRLRRIVGSSPVENCISNIALYMAQLATGSGLGSDASAQTRRQGSPQPNNLLLSLSDEITRHLSRDLQCSSPVFQRHLQSSKTRLIDALAAEVPKYLQQSFVDVSQALVCHAVLEKDAPYSYRHQFYPIVLRPEARIPGVIDLRDIVRQLTSLLVFHWRIWGPLLYAQGESGVDDWVNGMGWDSDFAVSDFLERFDDYPALRKHYYPTAEERAADAVAAARAAQAAAGGPLEQEDPVHGYVPEKTRDQVPRSERGPTLEGEEDVGESLRTHGR